MASPEKIHALYEAFATGFLGPVLLGGEARLTRALPPGLLEHFSLARPSDELLEERIVDQIQETASILAPAATVRFPDRSMIALAMAAHDLALVTDPAMDRTFARGARPKILDFADQLLEDLEAPRTRGEALARHAFVERLLAVQREDTVVKSWAYTYRFYGRPPPANVVAAPKLRFVREEKSRAPLPELLAEGEEADELRLEPRLRELLSRSPLTELLRTDLAPDLVFGQAILAVLSDPALRHGVAQALVLEGTGKVAQPFGHALRHLSALGPPPPFLFAAIAFLAELHVLEVLDARAGHRPKDEPAVGDEELFAAVLPALVKHRGGLASLMELAAPDKARVVERAATLTYLAGQDAVDFALAIMDRAAPADTQAAG
ncbi:MAG: hypothetical protein AAGH15_09235 [Myxococcota bacterium]